MFVGKVDKDGGRAQASLTSNWTSFGGMDSKESPTMTFGSLRKDEDDESWSGTGSRGGDEVRDRELPSGEEPPGLEEDCKCTPAQVQMLYKTWTQSDFEIENQRKALIL